MADVKIKLNSAGIRTLLKSAGIAGVCEAQAAKMTQATGMPYVPDVYIGRTRANAAGITKDSGSLQKRKSSGKRGKDKGNWITTADGKRRFVKGYARTDKDGKKTYTQLYKREKK